MTDIKKYLVTYSRLFGAAFLAAFLFFALPVIPAGAVSVVNKQLSDAIYDSALPLAEAEKLEEADKLLTQALLANPANAKAFALKGQMQIKLENIREGWRLQNIALNIEPNYLPALLWAGEAAIALKDRVDAEKHLARLKKICGTCAEFEQLQKSLAALPPRKPDEKTEE